MNLNYLFGRLRYSLSLLLVLSSLLLLSGCGANPLKFLTGGGPQVAANTQVGKTNTQTVGQTNNIAPSVSLRPDSRVEEINQSTNTIYEGPSWKLVAALCFFSGLLLPSHTEIARKVRSIYRKTPAS